MTHAFPPRPLPELPVQGSGLTYPVARIFCVGRNYAAHAAEMGNAVPDEPFWFTKSPFGFLPSDSILPYPPGTSDLHHEVELVLALGEGGSVWAHGVGLDMTRRDLQAKAKKDGKPWDTAKDWEGSAVIAPLVQGAPRPTPRSASPSTARSGRMRASRRWSTASTRSSRISGRSTRPGPVTS
ncbi:Fumarylacetoacetate hydrolase family protein [Rubellimicrobium mesophilum DSM 19309]|uniref:Fumarylacetoacetate hydrolase family protein n=1 Tax=Rubellimicrobium mesophilum DSM 19309 TaxID=442562 RepID=A0A017HQ44_9RHOB|nr:Fumarylacetoacetate hydrolase family protein [Rubellimicrobium mesophilum DSM 19309]